MTLFDHGKINESPDPGVECMQRHLFRILRIKKGADTLDCFSSHSNFATVPKCEPIVPTAPFETRTRRFKFQPMARPTAPTVPSNHTNPPYHPCCTIRANCTNCANCPKDTHRTNSTNRTNQRYEYKPDQPYQLCQPYRAQTYASI